MICSPTTYSAFKLMHDGILALSRAEQVGVQIDVEYCQKMLNYLERQINYYNKVFADTELARRWRLVFSKPNFNSDQQLAHILFKNMKIDPVKFTDNGNPSVDEEALSGLGIPDVECILKVRHLTKVKDTYIGGFLREQVNGIVHCFFNMHNIVSFRSSSDSINFQNIPNRDPELKRLCRKAIKARPGNKLLAADYSGAEIRGATCYHKDPVMVEYLLDESKDMHRDVAMDSFFLPVEEAKAKPVRQIGKNGFVFPQFYGDWWKSCASNMWHQAIPVKLKDGTPLIDHLAKKKIKNLEQFAEHIKKVEDIFWNKRFKVYNNWREDWWEDYCDRGYFDLLSGFRCGGVMNRKEAINYPIQGTSFHFLFLAFVLLDRIQDERKWRSRLIIEIHDEVVFDVYPPEEKEVAETIKWVMEQEVPRIFNWINVPLIAEMEITPTDGTWYDKVGFCKCGGFPEMDEHEYVMFCPECKKETAVCTTYDAAIKAWKELK